MLVKFEQSRLWSQLHEIFSFWQKKKQVFWNHFWQNDDAILFNVKLFISRLPSFSVSKIMVVQNV